MYVLFFTNQGPAIQIAIPKGKSVNARFYKGNVLHKLKKYFLSRRPATGLRGVRLLHDKASSHKAAIVREYLSSFRTLLIRQILPLVTRGSKTPRWNKISTRKNLGSAILQCLNSIPRKDYENAFKNWIKRLKLCLSHGGEYFEGLR